MVSSKWATKKGKSKASSSAIVPARSDKEVVVVDPELPLEEQAAPAQPDADARSKRRHDVVEEPRSKRPHLGLPPLAEKEPVKTTPAHVQCGPYMFDPQDPLPEPLVRRLETMKMDLHRRYSPRSPSMVDMTESTSPSTFCVKEREWLASLPVNVLFTETHRFCDMARLGIAEAWRYAAYLEEQCRRLEAGEIGGSAQDAEARKRVEAELEELKKKMEDQSQESEEFVKKANEKIARLVQGRKDAVKDRDEMKTKLESAEAALTEKTQLEAALSEKVHAEAALKEKLKEMEALLASKSASEQDFRTNFLKSDEFKELVGGKIYPHWQHGIRVGIRQAVARYGADNPSIAIFEPDYENHCGEPKILDSDEEAP